MQLVLHARNVISLVLLSFSLFVCAVPDTSKFVIFRLARRDDMANHLAAKT